MPFRNLSILLLVASIFGCGDPYEEPLPPRDRIHFPVGISVHPNGRFLYVVNSNFDTRYREDVGGTVTVVDLSTRDVLETRSPYIPSFGGDIKLNADASRAYVATRASNAIVSLAVSTSGSTLYCDRVKTDDGFVRGQTADPEGCSLRRVPDQDGADVVPSDPFGIDVTTLSIGGTTVDMVNVAHLRGQDVTSIAIPFADGRPNLPSASMRSAAITDSSNVVARRPGTRDIYVGDRNGGEIIVYFPYLAPENADVQAIVVRDAVVLNNEASIVDIRGITFSPDGETLYAVSRAPDALHIVDLGPSNPDTGGGTLNAVVTSVPVARQPTDVVWHTNNRGQDLLYIPSFNDESIVVIDPLSQVVVDIIEIGAQPYKFVINTGPNQCGTGQPCEAYVTLFNDLPAANGNCGDDRREPCGSVGVIDLNPDSPRYHTLTGKIF